jgi:haloalkane dehalogenase
MGNGAKVYTFDKPAVYRIRVEGTLDESWSSRLSGMQIVHDENKKKKKITILFGYLQDQSALSGVLTSLNDLGLPILSVECVSEE